MATTTRTIHATPEQVWRVLADGWLYPLWVVGASRIREVDPLWPGSGTELHHSIGVWPVLIDDSTRVTDSDPERSIALRGRGWPLGEADIVIDLHEVTDGTDGADGAGGTEVAISEDAVAGPGRLIPKPLRDVLIGWRNVETLRRLALVVEGREARSVVPGAAAAIAGEGR